MKLMPHIKALLDDLIKMTEYIVVKRSDLAEAYDTNSRTKLLYQECAEAIDGMTNFYSYKVYPKEVLREYSKWTETSDTYDFGPFIPILDKDIESKMENGAKMTISRNDPFTYYNGKIVNYNRQEIGNGWVQYKDDGYFRRVFNRKVNEININSNLYEVDDNNNPDYSKPIKGMKISQNSLTIAESISFYLFDRLRNSYIPININYLSEYVPILLNGENTYYNEEFGWNYCKDSNNQNIIFIDNPENMDQKIIYDPNQWSEEVKEKINTKYWLKYKIELRYSDDKYYNDNVYRPIDWTPPENEYGKTSDMVYYKKFLSNNINDFVYEDYYIQDPSGNYYYNKSTGLFEPLPEYDETNPEIVEFYKKIDINDIYRIATDENVDKFYNYYYIDSNLIIQDKIIKYINNEEIEIPRFETYDDNELNIKIFYNYSTIKDIDDMKICSPVIQYTTEEVIYNASEYSNYESDDGETFNFNTYTYISTENLSIYNFIQDSNGQYYYEDDEENPNYGCILKGKPSNKTRFSITDDQTNWTFAFYIDNYDMWISEKVFSDAQINSYYNNRENIPEAYRNDLAEMMDSYVIKLYCPKYFDRSENSIPLYTGETNEYYREINGLPSLILSYTNPRINRTEINPSYDGDYKNPYIYELSDSEIEYMEKSGLLDKYRKAYPDLGYLYYLGSNRVDVITARQSSPYDILSMNDAELPISKTIFMENYSLARSYVLKKQYYPELFQNNEYYHAYIGYLICVLAMIMCMTKSGELLIQNMFMDKETVDLILQSYGFSDTFNSIPLIYRREIAKNITKLIRNKGIDDIYKIIYKIFKIEDIDVYKYYFKKKEFTNLNGDLESSLSIAQSSINSENIIKDINNSSNSLNYDDITNSDVYWGVYDSKENVKKKLLDYKFNFLNSKYIALNNKFNLTELNFNSAYLLNYLLDATKRNDNSVKIEIDEIDESQELSDLIIALFAIQAIKYHFDGNIPSDIVSTAAVLKFNLDKTITGRDGKPKQIIDYYINYLSEDAAKAIKNSGDINDKSIESMMNNIIDENSAKAGQEVPILNYKSDITVTDLSERYLNNLEKDNNLTNINENSLYNRLIELRENATNFEDFRCFDELLKCISVTNESNQVYQLTIPKWELMYENDYIKSNGELIPSGPSEDGIIYYVDIRKSWNLLSGNDKKEILHIIDNNKIILKRVTNVNEIGKEYIPSSEIEHMEDGDYYHGIKIKYYDNNFYYDHLTNLPMSITQSDRVPGVNDFSNYSYIIRLNNVTRSDLLKIEYLKDSDIESKIDIYSKVDLMNNDSIIMNKLKILSNLVDKENLPTEITPEIIGNGNIIYSGYRTLDDFIENNISSSVGEIFYAEIRPILDLQEIHYKVKIYRKCEHALTYMMYLREEASNIYDYLQRKSNESDSEYLERINKFSSTIIATIESEIGSEDIRDKLKLSYNDFSNISKYIKLLINVFKSYTIDISSMDVIYNIDDKSNNRIKMIDDYYTNEIYSLKSNIHINDDYYTDEYHGFSDTMKIKDELYIEFYAREYHDVDKEDADTYMIVRDNIGENAFDKKISNYWYSKSLDNKYYSTDYMINDVIGDIKEDDSDV